jgi:hypothetical protein
MKILDVSVDRTNDQKKFDAGGKNWFIAIKFDSGIKLGVELKPEMSIPEIVIEFVQFINLILIKQ